ncbi:hypothetical protein F4556_006194 [Kitasatospora gansuensis]|uniref:Uncharacterized protein n=1 Tax=Kitasatospora gansuensis TaxID=258050 RepID=A0A7W7SHN4_9ACTN|nr:hypothetical protein [Kitasatospora gansuensis]MBB4950659.1 hypothetical protein [Kitasatospora gansuensis]
MNAPLPDEHARYAAYLAAFAAVRPEDEFALVATVLRDPDQSMAESAVIEHIGHRAAALHAGPAFGAWAEQMAAAVDRYPFAHRRIQEWSLWSAVALDTPWDAATLAEASNWLQLRVAETVASREALAVLAESGRTRRIRNIATSRSRARTLTAVDSHRGR